MSTSFAITLDPRAQALLARLHTLPANAAQAMARAMDKQNALTVSHIQRDYLSFARTGASDPTGLRVQTGSARRSLRASTATVTGNAISSGIGGNVTSRGVNYLAVHEYGATIPPHTITATNARALHFFAGGKEIFAKSVKFPGVTLPARGMIRRGINDRLPDYGRALSDAVINTLGAQS